MKKAVLIKENKHISPKFLSYKDLLDLNCFAINKNINIYATSNKYIYTLMRNISKEMMHMALKENLSIHVRNIHQLEMNNNTININKIVLSSNKQRIIIVRENLPNWIKRKFHVINKENQIIIYPKHNQR